MSLRGVYIRFRSARPGLDVEDCEMLHELKVLSEGADCTLANIIMDLAWSVQSDLARGYPEYVGRHGDMRDMLVNGLLDRLTAAGCVEYYSKDEMFRRAALPLESELVVAEKERALLRVLIPPPTACTSCPARRPSC